jgi:hypothetical protein
VVAGTTKSDTKIDLPVVAVSEPISADFFLYLNSGDAERGRPRSPCSGLAIASKDTAVCSTSRRADDLRASATRLRSCAP